MYAEEPMPIDQELLAFANSRSSWQRDALRRICTQTDLTENDVQVILSNLKSTEGLDQVGTQEQLAASHLANRTATSHSATILTSVSEVKNANRLAPNQTLLFAETGITLIYGYNGSGKTGYGRILKQVCRCRQEKLEPILGDVYTQGPLNPATATVTYKSGGVAYSTSWKDGTPAPSALGRLSVFDSTSAPLYADQQNKIEFLPLGLDVLPRFAKLCDELNTRITTDIATVTAKLAVPLPAVSSQKFMQFIARFGIATPIEQVPSEQEINFEFAWCAADDSSLLLIEEEIRKISEPAKLSAQCTEAQTLPGFHQRSDGNRPSTLYGDCNRRTLSNSGKCKGGSEGSKSCGGGSLFRRPPGDVPNHQ